MAAVEDDNLPDQVLVGPPGHGVTMYARDLVEALRETGAAARACSAERSDAALPLVRGVRRAHVHVTDRIFGSSPEAAAELVEDIGRATDLSITLHDLPQPSDGTNFERRRQAYSRFMAAASGVAVNSHHEAQLIDQYLEPPEHRPEIIPLGTRSARVGQLKVEQYVSPAANGGKLAPLTVLIAGYIYPGKGHTEAIDAVGALVDRLQLAGARPPAASVIAVGGPSAGHEGDVEVLRRRAEALGVEFRVTGFLGDDEYRREMSGKGIPLAAHQHVSASRSILDWMELGRNALVVESTYVREMARLRPGTMTVFTPGSLVDHLDAAWRDPASTFLPPGTSLSPTLKDAALAYRAWWTGGKE